MMGKVRTVHKKHWYTGIVGRRQGLVVLLMMRFGLIHMKSLSRSGRTLNIRSGKAIGGLNL